MTLDQTLTRLANECAAAPDRASRRRGLSALKRAARRGHATRAALEHLAGLAPRGATASAEWIGGEAGALPKSLWPLARTLIANDSLPSTPRLQVAGRLLDALPDTAGALDSVVAPLTAGLSQPKKLARLRALERHAEAAPGLSRLIESTARATHLRCPRCRFAFPARELPAHAWRDHALVWGGEHPAESSTEIAAAITEATAGDSSALDRAFTGAALFFPESPATDVLQAVESRGARDSAAVVMLAARAAEAGCGVCPNCLGPVPDPVAPPLPPASWGHGLVAADGYEVRVRDLAFGRQVAVTRPGAAPQTLGAARPGLPTTTRAALLAWPVALAGLIGAAILPGALPLAAAGAGGLAALAIYRVLRRERRGDSADWEAFDAAWEELTPGIGRSPAATRFLTRLCRLSIGVGRSEDRAARVRELSEQAAVLTESRQAPEYAALFAATRVLAAADGAARGLEPVAAFRALFEPVWRGELPARDAESVAELVLSEGVLEVGDELRLGHLLAADAFAAGFTPADLARLCEWLPELGRLLPAVAIPALFALRNLAYRKVGLPAWQLAAADPVPARELLATTPDLVLDVDFDAARAAITAQGLLIDGRLIDPAAAIEAGRGRRGPALRVGPLTLPLRSEPGPKAVTILRAAQAIAAELQALPRQTELSPKGHAALASLLATCPLCGERAIVRAGRIGELFGDQS